MNSKEVVQSAKESFEKILLNEKYSSIIRDDRHLDLLLNMLPLKQCSEVLDIGTGAGYLAFPVAQQDSSCNVTGIDIAEKVIIQNQVKVKENHIENLHFCSFDGINYPFTNESMDIIMSRYVFHHFPDVEMAVKQIAGILRKNGKILLSDPVRNPDDKKKVIDKFMQVKGDGHIGFYTQEEITSLFAKNGIYQADLKVTCMEFPFPEKQEYNTLFNSLDNEEKEMYNIYLKENIVWIGNINVVNILMEKR